MPLYWTRWTVSAAFDTATTVANLLALNRSTTYAGIVNVETEPVKFSVQWGINGIGCVEALTDAGTANLVINAATRSDGSRFT